MRTNDIPSRAQTLIIWYVLTLLKLPVYLWFFAGVQLPAFDSPLMRGLLVGGIVLYEALWLTLCAVGAARAAR